MTMQTLNNFLFYAKTNYYILVSIAQSLTWLFQNKPSKYLNIKYLLFQG